MAAGALSCLWTLDRLRHRLDQRRSSCRTSGCAVDCTCGGRPTLCAQFAVSLIEVLRQVRTMLRFLSLATSVSPGHVPTTVCFGTRLRSGVSTARVGRRRPVEAPPLGWKCRTSGNGGVPYFQQGAEGISKPPAGSRTSPRKRPFPDIQGHFHGHQCRLDWWTFAAGRSVVRRHELAQWESSVSHRR